MYPPHGRSQHAGTLRRAFLSHVRSADGGPPDSAQMATTVRPVQKSPSLCVALMSSCKNTRVSHRNVSCCTYALRVHYTDLHSAPLKRSFVNTSYLYLLRNPLRRYSFTSSFGSDSIHYLGNVPAKRVFASLRIILLITPQIPCDLLLRIIFCAC